MTAIVPAGAGWKRGALLRLTAVAMVGLIDAVIWQTPMPRLLFGVCDEVAHLTTAVLLLSAWHAIRGTRPSSEFVVAALASAVLIDLDHLPDELFGAKFLTEGTNRPYGHTLLTVALATVAALLLRSGRGGRFASGIAVGVTLHLLRDLPTGGTALLWPVGSWTIGYPYPVYLALLLIAAVAPAVCPTCTVGITGRSSRSGAAGESVARR